jgi:2-iminobutanoate/2-iminopropanoate deaminase
MAEGITAQATKSFENVKHVFEAAGLTMDNIVKTTVYLADMSLFGDMNKVYATYFNGAFPCSFSLCRKAIA